MENQSTVTKTVSEKLHDTLQEMIGLHRQLYDVVKVENAALTNADVKGTYEAAATKEALVHWIHQAEMSRQAIVFALSQEEGFENQTPSLREVINFYQGKNSEISNKLQTDLTTLVVLVERIQSQNKANGKLVNGSLKHLTNMKKNIFGDGGKVNPTYNQHGQKNQSSAGASARLISKEV